MNVFLVLGEEVPFSQVRFLGERDSAEATFPASREMGVSLLKGRSKGRIRMKSGQAKGSVVKGVTVTWLHLRSGASDSLYPGTSHKHGLSAPISGKEVGNAADRHAAVWSTLC